MPMVWGETGETFDASQCGTDNISTFLAWADAHGVGHEPWTWNTWGTCLSLIDAFDGTPNGAYGTFVRDYYLANW